MMHNYQINPISNPIPKPGDKEEGKPKNRPKEHPHIVRRLTILHRASCCPIFDRIYSWKTEDRTPTTSAKLISLFNNIGQTFKDDENGGRRVIFEQALDTTKKTKTHGYTTGLPSLGGRGTSTKATTASTAGRYMMSQDLKQQSTNDMEVFIQNVDEICVAVYIKPMRYIDDSFQPEFLVAIGDTFCAQYASTFNKMRNKFAELCRDQEEARNNLSMLPLFNDFEPTFHSDFITEDSTSSNSLERVRIQGPVAVPLSSDLIAVRDPLLNSTTTPFDPRGNAVMNNRGIPQPSSLPNSAAKEGPEHKIPSSDDPNSERKHSTSVVNTTHNVATITQDHMILDVINNKDSRDQQQEQPALVNTITASQDNTPQNNNNKNHNYNSNSNYNKNTNPPPQQNVQLDADDIDDLDDIPDF